MEFQVTFGTGWENGCTEENKEFV